MASRKVPLYQKPLAFTTVEEGATKGATVGTDLRWPDGTVVTQEQLRQAAEDTELEILGLMSVQVIPTVSGQFALQLVGDIQAPGLNFTYATDPTTGEKGWFERLLSTLSDVDYTTPPVAGDALIYDGTNWAPGAVPDASVPYFIPDGETYTVAVNKQALFTIPIDIGIGSGLLVDGILVEVD